LIEINCVQVARLARRPAEYGIRVFAKDINRLGMPVVVKTRYEELLSVFRLRTDLHFAAGAIRKRFKNVPASDNACQSMVAVDGGNAPDAMIDHELEYARQFGVGSNVNEFRSHDIGDGSAHQLLILGNHLVGREYKAFQQIELGHNADNLRILLDRIGVEIVALEHVAQIAHGELARHRLHGVGHMTGNGFFEKFIHGAIPSIVVVSALMPNATAIRNDWIG
jgi:hypothetical protein